MTAQISNSDTSVLPGRYGDYEVDVEAIKTVALPLRQKEHSGPRPISAPTPTGTIPKPPPQLPPAPPEENSLAPAPPEETTSIAPTQVETFVLSGVPAGTAADLDLSTVKLPQLSLSPELYASLSGDQSETSQIGSMIELKQGSLAALDKLQDKDRERMEQLQLEREEENL